MSGVTISTEPLTPASFSEDVTERDDSDIFAWLHPLNEPARDAFHATMRAIAKYQLPQEARQFLQAEHKVDREGSIFTEDEGVDEEANRTSFLGNKWQGSYKFSLSQLPHDPSRGWCLGTGRGLASEEEVDIILAPQTDQWAKLGLAGKHARIFFHPDLCRFVLQARHTVIVSSNGTRKLSRSEVHVLAQGEAISIGHCLYSFVYTDLFSHTDFHTDLARFMKQHSGNHWSMNNLLSPTSITNPMTLGRYSCTPHAFDEGSFGRVIAGWTHDGKTVAIKQFKQPREKELNSHKMMMDFIGGHENIVQLVECITQFDMKVPSAFCIYTPLAVGSLQDVMGRYEPDDAAKVTLLHDYLNGLSYLHDQKHVMHLDIKAANLAVISPNTPKGVILDLDSATTDSTSMDHRKGTVPYLAPEIIAVKEWEEGVLPYRPPPFGKSADVWALGLTMYALHTGHLWTWMGFTTTEEARLLGPKRNRVTKILHHRFRARIAASKASSTGSQAKRFLGWVERMTEFGVESRVSATDLLKLVSIVQKDEGCGTLSLRTGQKRGREEG